MGIEKKAKNPKIQANKNIRNNLPRKRELEEVVDFSFEMLSNAKFLPHFLLLLLLVC